MTEPTREEVVAWLEGIASLNDDQNALARAALRAVRAWGMLAAEPSVFLAAYRKWNGEDDFTPHLLTAVERAASHKEEGTR